MFRPRMIIQDVACLTTLISGLGALICCFLYALREDELLKFPPQPEELPPQARLQILNTHLIIKQLAGHLLHPSVRTQARDVKVADVGAGTGIWAIEMSGQLPSGSTIHAFDISSAQYPPQAWTPSNVHFHTQDAFAPFPQEFVGTFDIVHIRFFLTLVNTKTMTTLMTNLTSLLKPRGYLQWVEPDMLSAKVSTASADLETSATEKLVTIMRQPTPDAEYSWIQRLGSIFSEHGLDDVGYDHIPMIDKYRTFMGQIHIMTYEEFCDKLEETNLVDQAQEGRKIIEKLRTEFSSGSYANHDYVCVVGRKRLEQQV